MQEASIVFSGSDESGAAKAIATLSDVAFTTRDFPVHEESGEIDPTGTVRLDYGVLHLDDDRVVHLYGTPDRARVGAVANALQLEGIGLVLLLDGRRTYPLRDMHFYLHAFKAFIADSAVALGIVGLGPKASFGIDDYQQQLREQDLHVPVFEVDVANRHDLVTLVEALLLSAAAAQSLAN